MGAFDRAPEAAHALAETQSHAQLRARIGLARHELSDTSSVNLRTLRNGGDRQITACGLMEYSMVLMVSSCYREALETIDENLQILVTHAIDRPEFKTT